jgi:hypothetical protein
VTLSLSSPRAGWRAAQDLKSCRDGEFRRCCVITRIFLVSQQQLSDAQRMLSSRKDAIDLLTKCKEDGSSLLALAYFANEKHEFSCKVERVSAEEVVLSGKFAVVTIPLEESATFEYSETHEMPPRMLEILKRLDYCLTIHTPKVRVILAVARPLF